MSKFRVTKIIVGGNKSSLKEPRVDAIEKPLPHPYSSKAFRMMIVGPSGSGKSQFFVNLLTKPEAFGFNKEFGEGVFDFVYLFCPTYDTDETLNVLTKPGQKTGETFLDEKSVYKVSDKESITGICQEIIKSLDKQIKEVDEDEVPVKTLIVFDDLTEEVKTSEIITNLFTKGRKHEISVIIITNQYKRYPPGVRNGVTQFVIFKPATSQELKNILADISFNKERIERLAAGLFKENPKAFIYIDKTAPENEGIWYSDQNGELHKY